MWEEQRLTQRQYRKVARLRWFRGTLASLRSYELAEITAELWEMCEDALLQVKAQEGEAELLASLRMSCVICRHRCGDRDAGRLGYVRRQVRCCLEGEFKDCENSEYKRCKLYIRGVSLRRRIWCSVLDPDPAFQVNGDADPDLDPIQNRNFEDVFF
jgi:hypothetical protein